MMSRTQWLPLQCRTQGRLVTATMMCLALFGAPANDATARSDSGAGIVTEARGRSLAFEPNRGQTADGVRFIARGSDYTAFLTADEAVLVPRARRNAPASDDAVRMKLVGANASSETAVADALPGKVNYVPESGPVTHLTGIPTYGKVRYEDVYPGIDVVWYDNQGRLEYDFVVSPGADPDVIALDFAGTQSIDIEDDGALVLRTSAGTIRQPAPVVYQERDDVREPVAGRWFPIGSQRVGIRLASYDRARPLVIDPLLTYSSYLGGRGDDWGMDIAVDAAGNTYVAGGTTSPDFPGAPTRSSTADAAFVSKLSASGVLLYSTYLLQTDERGATGIAVDALGNAYVTGRTSLWRATAGNDVFVAKLDAFGRVARPSGYFFTFGGTGIDWGNRIAVDGAGNAFVTGVTSGGTFPTTTGAFRRIQAGGNDAFVTKVNAAGTGFVWSTLLGGSGDDSANDIARDIAGNVYVTGSTQSIDFPVSAGAYQRTHRGCDTTWLVMCSKTVFVTKLNASGTGLAYSTYLGGSGIDQESIAEGIAVDGAGNAYVTGVTSADNFPTTAGVVQPNAGYPLCYYEACTDAFVTKLNTSGSALVYSTYLVGETQDYANGIAIDSAGNAYIAGGTSSRYFPLQNAFQPKKGSHEDAFVVKLNANASRFLYSSYLGGAGNGNDLAGASAATGIAVDMQGRAHVTGLTSASDFPTSAGAAQRIAGGCNNAFYGCSDAFVTRVAATGAGVAQATSVAMASTRAVRGSYVSVTWSGMPAPTPWDTLNLYPLGSSDEPYDVWGGWYTTGAANGTVQLWLPATLATGWYELRLWSSTGFYGPVARSSPFQLFAQ
jgi:hypothetical protein